MKKKALIILVTCFICIFVFVSTAGSWGAGTVYVRVYSKHYRSPISWAYVSVGRSTCWNIGWGYYSATTSIGWHCVYVWGVPKWVYVGWGYTRIDVYI